MNKIITFCRDKCCPVIEITDNEILLGDANGIEGVTKWSKKQFQDFLNAVKDGKFDDVIDEQ